MNTLRPSAHRRLQRGMTLIELLVAVTIGLVVTLAVTSTLIVGEAQKRSTTSTNDMNQSGNYAAYLLDRVLRSAGSGFSQSWNQGVFGCELNAARQGTVILPRASAFPVPFDGLLGGAGPNNAGDLRVAPVLIGAGQSASGSDVLVVMGGNAGAGDVPRRIRGSAGAANLLRMDNTVGLAEGDMALVSQSGIEDCLIEQVSGSPPFADSVNNDVLPLNGTYYTAGPSEATLATLANGTSAVMNPLGNAAAGNVQFQMFGVGANRTLFSYDLLQNGGTDASQALSDGVVAMYARYGLDTNTNGVLDAWAAPDAAGFDIKSVMKTPATARQIVAVRVALVMRSSIADKTDVTSEIPIIFSDLASKINAVPLNGDDRRYRYRVVEFTVPLRNMLLLQ